MLSQSCKPMWRLLILTVQIYVSYVQPRDVTGKVILNEQLAWFQEYHEMSMGHWAFTAQCLLTPHAVTYVYF